MTGHAAIIGLAHGSRHPDVRGPIDALMAATAELAGVPARAAYLDLTDPDLATVAADLAAGGVERAVVVPLLFTSAYHARIDVPATVEAVAALTHLDLVTADVLGTGDDIAATVHAHTVDAGIPPELPALLYAVGSSDPAANDAVADLGGRLARLRAAPVRVGFGTTDPRPEAVLAALGTGPVAVVPLFVSPGLLLDPLVRLASDRGWPITGPLGDRLAPIVAARYRAVVSQIDPNFGCQTP